MHISVITPTKNRAGSYLKDCIQSVAVQRLEPGWVLEHVVCDDGSGPEDRAALEDLAHANSHMRVVRHATSLGVSAARNSAFLASRGEVVLDLDDDDMLPAESLAARVNHLIASSRSWSCGNLLKVDESRRYLLGGELFLSPREVPADRASFMQGLLSGSLFAWAGTRTYLRTALLAAGPWDTTFPVAEDLEHWLRLTVRVGPPAWFFGPAALFREKPRSLGIDAARDGSMRFHRDRARARYANWSDREPSYVAEVPAWVAASPDLR